MRGRTLLDLWFEGQVHQKADVDRGLLDRAGKGVVIRQAYANGVNDVIGSSVNKEGKRRS
jgi:hypothetical protein